MIDTVEELHGEATAHTMSERVLVRAPSGDDAALIKEVLGVEGCNVVPVDDLSTLAREAEAGAGVFLITTEALNDEQCCRTLRQILDAQEPWSELPVVLLGGGEADEVVRATALLGERAQLLVLERPLGIRTLVSAIETALRSRRRQYEVKGLLDELAASALAVARAHQEADRRKDEFLATLAHELRSPMTAIRGWVQMLKLGVLPPDQAMAALSMIEASTKVQANIIEDLMDVSRILAGKIMIDPAVITLAPVVNNIIETFRPGAAAKDIELTAQIAPEPLLVFADESRLQQVGWNLLSNSVKFTPEGGSVRVALARDGGNAVLRIRDSGEGIAPELLPHVFDRYRQGEGLGGKAKHGLGLGLAIVRHLVESHGGTVEARSEGRGLGAEFVLTLPLREL